MAGLVQGDSKWNQNLQKAHRYLCHLPNATRGSRHTIKAYPFCFRKQDRLFFQEKSGDIFLASQKREAEFRFVVKRPAEAAEFDGRTSRFEVIYAPVQARAGEVEALGKFFGPSGGSPVDEEVEAFKEADLLYDWHNENILGDSDSMCVNAFYSRVCFYKTIENTMHPNAANP